ncbi:FIST C-terminal domain-containing protein [Candidatus Woesearchaeota archaeon]|nr:FIST C-terminal domain-containing protein [Candidatus Woesearchaeota archaeon]
MKRLLHGVGFSKNEDSYTAAKEAANTALEELNGETPSLSLMFYAGNYDAYEINKALKEVFQGTEFIGGSTDAVIFEENIIPKGVVVCSLSSPYLHFGISSNDGIMKDPLRLAQKTARQAVDKLSVDKHLDSYLQFARMKKSGISSIIRIPSFFCWAFTRGYQKNKLGNEDLIINGITDTIGKYVPLFGGSLGNDMDKVFRDEPYDIYTFHSGKVMKDGLIVAFASTGLVYNNSLEHGGEPKGPIGYISKLSNNGFVVEEICGQPVRSWYASTIGVSVTEFNKKLLYYTQKYPLGFPDGYGNIVMRAGGNPFKEYLAYIAPFKENTPVVVMDLQDNKKLIRAPEIIEDDMERQLKKRLKPEVSFLVSCCSRRRILPPEYLQKEMKIIAKKSAKDLFGFCSFGEIGSKPAETCHFHHLCVNQMNLFENILSDL